MIDDIAVGLRTQSWILGYWFLSLWLILLVDRLVPGANMKARMAVRPREISSLSGVLTFSFCHIDSAHLLSNSTTLFFLAWLVMLTEQFWVASLLINLVGGIGVWLLGRPKTAHIGASGFIYGYLGYLVLYGFLVGSGRILIASALLAWIYRYSVYGLSPKLGRANISWEGHLFGLAGGMAAAWWLTPR